jgi:hypothetical protein
MNRYLLLLLTLLSCLNSCRWRRQSPSKVLGSGLLTVNTQYPIPLYKSEKDQSPFDVLTFETRPSGEIAVISKIDLKPYLLTSGDTEDDAKKNIRQGLVRFTAELKFCVIDSGETFFRVITNQQTLESFIIKRDPRSAYYTTVKVLREDNPRWYIYETWDRYLRRVEYITKVQLTIYDVPNGRIIFENRKEAFMPFSVLEVKGEWIRLGKGLTPEGTTDTGNRHTGWTRWRKGTVKLIDITEKTYE